MYYNNLLRKRGQFSPLGVNLGRKGKQNYLWQNYLSCDCTRFLGYDCIFSTRNGGLRDIRIHPNSELLCSKIICFKTNLKTPTMILDSLCLLSLFIYLFSDYLYFSLRDKILCKFILWLVILNISGNKFRTSP